MKLTSREHGLVDRVIQKIKGFDPQAIVQIADGTLEHEDILLYVYTDKGSWTSYITLLLVLAIFWSMRI